MVGNMHQLGKKLKLHGKVNFFNLTGLFDCLMNLTFFSWFKNNQSILN